MLGRRAQHRAEAAEHVRADRLALVALDQHAVEALALEHVEVVEPEVDQHLLQLARAVQRLQQALVAGLDVDRARPSGAAPRLPRSAASCRRATRSRPAWPPSPPWPSRGIPAISSRCDSLGVRSDAELVGEEGRQRQTLGMQLLGDPRARAHARDALEVAGRRAEREPVQHVQRLGLAGRRRRRPARTRGARPARPGRRRARCGASSGGRSARSSGVASRQAGMERAAYSTAAACQC